MRWGLSALVLLLVAVVPVSGQVQLVPDPGTFDSDLTMGAGTQILFDNLEGSASLPAIAWSDAGGVYDTGIFQNATNGLAWTTAGAQRARLSDVGFVISTSGALGFDTATGPGDLFLEIDAANILACRNGSSACEFRIYNTFTDSSNGEWTSFGYINNSNVFTFENEANGTGTVRNFRFDGGDILVSDPTNGGDAGARNTLTANFNINVKSLGTMTNGSTETVPIFDDTPAGECAEVGGQTVTDDSTIVRVGTNSLKLVFESPPAAGEGVDCTITSDDFEGNESVGFWFRTTVALTATGDMYMELDDTDETDVTFDFPTVATVNQWSWIELDITTCATCDTVDGVKFFVDATGATTLSGATVNFDFAHKWDLDDEETLSADVVQDGVLGVTTLIDATGSARRTVDLVENTDFFVHYQSTDAIVTMTDQSTKSGTAYIAVQ